MKGSNEGTRRTSLREGRGGPGTTGSTGRRRARIRGGDLPRGGRPLGPGHAGRREGSLLAAAAVLACTLLVALAWGTRAQAETGSEYWTYNKMGEYVMYADFYTTTGNKGYCAEYEKHGPKGVTYNTWYYTGEASSSMTRSDPHALAWLATHLYPVDPTMNGRSPDNPQKASQLAVWMLQGDCSYGGTTKLGVDAVGDGATRNDVNVAAALAQEALGYAGKTGPWDRGSKIWASPDNSHQNMLEVIPMGRIAVVKESSEKALTNNNDCYSLKGASYVIYADKACTKAVETITTDEQGRAASGDLPLGTYWVRESGASPGFMLDVSAHEVTVAAGKTTSVTVEEVPLRLRLPILLRKVDADGAPQAQGAASLAGARLEVSLYKGHLDASSLPEKPWRSWKVVTGADGSVSLDTTVIKEDLLKEDGKVSLPLGTLVVRELEPPEGYEPLTGALVAHIKVVSGEPKAVPVGGWKKLGDVADQVVRGGFSVRKADAQTDATPQGDASLAGAEFAVVNLGPGPVVVGGTSYEAGKEVLRITSGEDGVATTGEGVLPYGDYEVREAKTPEGYLPNETWSAKVQVRGRELVSLVEEPCVDEVIRGGVLVGKVSRETMAHAPQGAATLAGAVLEVTLDSPNAVVVDGERRETGSVVATLVTDAKGVAQTPERALPYGTYTVREVTPPKGYEPNEEWSATFQVREDGKVIDLSSEESSVDDQVMRGGLRFNKIEAGSMASVGHCPFLITSETTGESHLVVTDENGEFDSERIDHAKDTNANDAAVRRNDDGSVTSADDALLNPDAGLWFAGDLAHEVAPSADKALPYDTYLVQEVRCKANTGLELVSFKVFVTRDDHVVDRGTVSDDAAPLLETHLFHEGEREAPATKVTLTDIVTCQGLVPGQEYVVTGTLHDSTTGDQIGEPSSITVVPRVADETVEVPLEVDLTDLAGRDVVAFEDLSQDGEVIAQHADLTSTDQTISVKKKDDEPDKPAPKEPEPAKPAAPTPTPRQGVTPKTGDTLPDAAVPAGIAALGGGLAGLGRLAHVRLRRRPARRIY